MNIMVKNMVKQEVAVDYEVWGVFLGEVWWVGEAEGGGGEIQIDPNHFFRATRWPM